MKDPIQKIIEKIPPFITCGGQEFGFAILHDTNEMKMGFFPVGNLPELWVNPLTHKMQNYIFYHPIKTMEDFEEGYYLCVSVAEMIEKFEFLK